MLNHGQASWSLRRATAATFPERSRRRGSAAQALTVGRDGATGRRRTVPQYGTRRVPTSRRFSSRGPTLDNRIEARHRARPGREHRGRPPPARSPTYVAGPQGHRHCRDPVRVGCRRVAPAEAAGLDPRRTYAPTSKARPSMSALPASDNDWGAGLLDGYEAVAHGRRRRRARRRSRPINASPARSPTSGASNTAFTLEPGGPRRADRRDHHDRGLSRIACSTSVLSDACSYEWNPDLDASVASTRTEGSSTRSTCAAGDECGRRPPGDRCMRCRRLAGTVHDPRHGRSRAT